MSPTLQRLFEISQKPERRIIGLMSGTSLDGLDVVLCRFTGSGMDTKVTVEQFKTIPYSEDLKTEIRAVFAKKQVDFQHLTLLNPLIGKRHAAMVLQCLAEWKIQPKQVDLIASHGQTVFHVPRILHGLIDYPNATLQIGDGDHLAVDTGIITLSDFRQKHIAAGGEGAPLAVYGDFFIFSDTSENRLLLNIGGIANFTSLPAGKDPTRVFVTDTGPGNTMIDAASRHYFQRAYDEDSHLARQGSVNLTLLNALKSDPFFEKPVPKTTGPELFNLSYLQRAQQQSRTKSASPYDLIATLTRFSAETIAESIQKEVEGWENFVVYLSGGGAHNPLLTTYLRKLLQPCRFDHTDSLGISGDAKEAVLFATLANETVSGKPVNFGNLPSVSMGKISLPA